MFRTHHIFSCLGIFLMGLVLWMLDVWNFDGYNYKNDGMAKMKREEGDDPMVTTTTTTTRVEYCQDLQQRWIQSLYQDDNNTDAMNRLGLRSATVSLEGEKNEEDVVVNIPGLDESLLRSALDNQTVVVLGDSTLMYLTKWLYVTMNQFDDNSSNNSSNNNNNNSNTPFVTADMDLTTANHIVNPDMDKQVHLNGAPSSYIYHGKDESNTQVRYIDIEKVRKRMEACDFLVSLENILNNNMRPDILVVNMGLHWFHLMAGGRHVNICTVYQWTYYERDFLEDLVTTAQASGTKLLILKTTNLICHEKFNAKWERAVKGYSSPQREPAMMNECVSILQKKQIQQQPFFNLTVEQLERYCRHGVMMERGSQYLNKRLKSFVEGKQKSLLTTTRTIGEDLQITLFNDHDVDSCQYTTVEDGRHYHPLNLVRIRMLANMITCLQNK